MDNRQYIKNFAGQFLFMIDTDSKGNQTLRDWPSYKILGYYHADRDVTTDFYGRVISKGNTLAALQSKK